MLAAVDWGHTAPGSDSLIFSIPFVRLRRRLQARPRDAFSQFRGRRVMFSVITRSQHTSNVSYVHHGLTVGVPPSADHIVT